MTARESSESARDATTRAFGFSRAAALPFGAFLICIETWRRWHQLGEIAKWPVIFDDYMAGAFLIAASIIAGRSPAKGRTWLAGAWGVATGMMYGSVFAQLGPRTGPDPSGFGTSSVVAVKVVMFALCVAGLVAALRSHPRSARGGA